MLPRFNHHVFHDAVQGLLLIEHIYGLNYNNISDASDITPKIRQATKYQRTMIRQFNSFDLILLASRAIQFGWHDSALRLLNFA